MKQDDGTLQIVRISSKLAMTQQNCILMLRREHETADIIVFLVATQRFRVILLRREHIRPTHKADQRPMIHFNSTNLTYA